MDILLDYRGLCRWNNMMSNIIDDLYFGVYEVLGVDTEYVNHPDHYQSENGVECIDAIAAATEYLTGEEAFCTASAIKYLWRWKKKGKPIEDLKKAKWYIDRIIEKMEDENAE